MKLRKRINRWHIVELLLVEAILLVGWHMFDVGERVTDYVNGKKEARADEKARLPKGGAVAHESGKPLLALSYHWRNFRSDQSLLLPDITPIIGEDTTITQQYPNGEMVY